MSGARTRWVRAGPAAASVSARVERRPPVSGERVGCERRSEGGRGGSGGGLGGRAPGDKCDHVIQPAEVRVSRVSADSRRSAERKRGPLYLLAPL